MADYQFRDAYGQALVGTFHEIGYILSAASPATGGTFTITVNGNTTSALDFDATTTEVRDAIAALTGLSTSDITVTLVSGGPDLGDASTLYALDFHGALNNTDPTVSINTGSLTGGSPHQYLESIRQSATISSSPPGTTPKGALGVINGNASVDTITSHVRSGRGYYDGTNQRATSFYAQDNTSVATAGAGVGTDAGAFFILPGTTSSATVARAVATSLDTNGITFDWSPGKKPVSNFRFVIRMLFGTDAQVAVGSLNTSGSIDGEATATPGFQIDGAEFMCAGLNFSGESNQTEAMRSVGHYGRVLNQQAYSVATAQHNADPTSCSALADTNGVVAYVDPTGPTLGPHCDVTSVTSTQFKLTTRAANQALAVAYFAYRIGGQRVWVGAPTLDTNSTGTGKTLTGIGFRPAAGFTYPLRVGSMGTLNTGAGGGSFGSGFADANSSQAGAAGTMVDNRNSTSQADTDFSLTHWTQVITNGSSRDYRSAFTSFDTDGLTYSVDDASTADRPVPMALVEHQGFTKTPNPLNEAVDLPAPTIIRTLAPTPLNEAVDLPAPTIIRTLQPGALDSAIELPAPTVDIGAGETLTPGALDTVQDLPAPTIIRTLLPGPLDAATELPTPVLDRMLAPGPLDSPVELPTPVLDRTLAPGPLDSPVELPTPTLDRTLLPGPLDSPVELPAPTVGLMLEPGPLDVAVELPAPTLIRTLEPGPLDAAMELPTPVLDRTLAPGPLDSPVELPAPTLDRTLLPGPLDSAVELPAPVLDRTLAPDPLDSPVELPAPMVMGAGVFLPDPLDSPVELPTPTLDRTLLPGPLDAAMELPAPVLNRTLTPGPLDAATELPDPTLSYTATPGPLDVAVDQPDPILLGTGILEIDEPVDVAVELPAPTLIRTLLPGPLDSPVELPPVMIGADVELRLALECPRELGLAMDTPRELGLAGECPRAIEVLAFTE